MVLFRNFFFFSEEFFCEICLNSWPWIELVKCFFVWGDLSKLTSNKSFVCYSGLSEFHWPNKTVVFWELGWALAGHILGNFASIHRKIGCSQNFVMLVAWPPFLSSTVNPLASGEIIKRSYILKQTCSFQLQVCLDGYDLSVNIKR